MVLIFVKYNFGHSHIHEIFKLDCFFIENYYKMCVAIIMADLVAVVLVIISIIVMYTIVNTVINLSNLLIISIIFIIIIIIKITWHTELRKGTPPVNQSCSRIMISDNILNSKRKNHARPSAGTS